MGDYEETSPKTMRFESILQGQVPKGRDGKHKKIITQLLSDIAQLPAGSALKIPLAELPDSKESSRRIPVGRPPLHHSLGRLGQGSRRAALPAA